MIKLYKEFNYDNSYNYIKTFTTIQNQENYFNSLKETITFEETEYVKDNQEIRVPYEHEELMIRGYNYLSFMNNDKVIYAFITSKEYVRKNVTRLIYEIDVIQTFMFNFNLERSFVERKVCTIDEITDFDEGLNIGEHHIESDTVVLNKTSKWFAMFNGFKEQELIFDDRNRLSSSVDIPYNTSKPLTVIDDVQYPLYFLPLEEQRNYRMATYEDIGIGSGGSSENLHGDAISKKIFRFLKGYEAFATNSYVDSGGVVTKGYGITEGNDYYASLGVDACSEELASNVLAEACFQGYALPLYTHMQNDGVDMALVKQNHFDAFLSLAYNGGLGAVIDSPMYLKWILDTNNPTITSDWETWYIKDQLGNVSNGLIDRRQKEVMIFRDNIYTFKPIGVVVDNVGTISGIITDNNGHGHIPEGLGGVL